MPTDNLENLPLGNVDVPLNKIVRCRWRDEDDSEDKIKDNITRIGDVGWTYSLQGMRLDTVEKWIEYLMVAEREIYSTPELAEIKARTMPLDMVEQWVGHHRVASAHQLGTWYIWAREHEGKRDLVPFVLKDATIDEARTIYIHDNLKNDGQTAGWAIGNVRKMRPELMAKGMSKSEANAWLVKHSGFELKSTNPSTLIGKLEDIDRGLQNGIVSPAIKRLKPDDAIEMWKLVLEFHTCSPVSFDRQKEIVDNSFGSANPRKSIGNAFSKLREALPEPVKVVISKPKESPAAAGLKLIQKAAEKFRQAREDDFEFGEQELLLITEAMQYLSSVVPTVDLTEVIDRQQAVAAAFAAMEEEEDNDGTVQLTEVEQGVRESEQAQA